MASQYGQMAAPATMIRAGEKAGEVVKSDIQDLIYLQPTLNGEDPAGGDFTDVAEKVSVWTTSDDVRVGVHPGSSVIERAREMVQVMPVVDVAFERSRAKVKSRFEQALQDEAF